MDDPANLLPRIEIEVRGYTYRFYVRHKDFYDSSFQMTVDGDEGNIHSLNGDKFFEVVPMFYKSIFPPGIRFVTFVMMSVTLKKLRAVTREFYNIETVGDPIKKGGRAFHKVRISLK